MFRVGSASPWLLLRSPALRLQLHVMAPGRPKIIPAGRSASSCRMEQAALVT
jgi:hypothetical protein